MNFLKSITWRLQFWHALILLVVVTGLSTAWFVQARRARLSEIDSQLLSAARVLDGSLRGIRLPTVDNPADEITLNEALQRRLSLPRPPEPDRTGETTSELPYFAIWLQGGRLLKSERLPGDFPDVENKAMRRNTLVTQRGSNREVEIIGPSGTRIVVGLDIRPQLDSLRTLAGRIIAISVGILTLGLVGGWWLTRSVLRPIHAMSAAARRFSVKDMSPRIDTRYTDTELGELARLLNAAFDRVQNSFDQQQQFAADASHELRTPLAVIQSQIELALRKNRAPEDYVRALGICAAAGDRLSELIESLLTLARLDSSETPQLVATRLDLVVAKCIDLMRPVADHADVTFTTELSQVTIAADAKQLEHAVLNLLKNAITYNRPGGSVTVTVVEDTSSASGKLSIQDTGIGIAPEELGRVTERFYRVDKARSRELGGSGLGLSIAKQIIESHHGTFEIQSTSGSGTEITIAFPTAEV